MKLSTINATSPLLKTVQLYVGLVTKSLQLRVLLGTLFLATQLADLLWPTLLLLSVLQVQIHPGLLAASPLTVSIIPSRTACWRKWY